MLRYRQANKVFPSLLDSSIGIEFYTGVFSMRKQFKQLDNQDGSWISITFQMN